MNQLVFWQRWLFIVGLVITIFGIMFALFNGAFLFEIFRSQINPVFWGTSEIPDRATSEFQSWIYGVLGATIAGWGVFLAYLARYPFKNKERWAWNCILIGLLVWFVIDTAISINFKVYFNAAFNALLLASVLIPLWFSRKHF